MENISSIIRLIESENIKNLKNVYIIMNDNTSISLWIPEWDAEYKEVFFDNMKYYLSKTFISSIDIKTIDCFELLSVNSKLNIHFFKMKEIFKPIYYSELMVTGNSDYTIYRSLNNIFENLNEYEIINLLIYYQEESIQNIQEVFDNILYSAVQHGNEELVNKIIRSLKSINFDKDEIKYIINNNLSFTEDSLYDNEASHDQWMSIDDDNLSNDFLK